MAGSGSRTAQSAVSKKEKNQQFTLYETQPTTKNRVKPGLKSTLGSLKHLVSIHLDDVTKLKYSLAIGFSGV
ncbi:hypothetical protein [Acidocella aminolytica]|jgi:hypothetical protein|uniref:Uncharacterized protein n=1 Tax=Acidocella aminolytica 101 = DSM 11237 TaxID=1120923 RepID=A0A0D6PCY5_9PROT|nr:hypothetical protein [Acidocella aminolytica]GAN79605.1 hypothetical protein Aam_024_007 [Acidocella aminolytica 101 = DSM 11237]GBQ37895.1 hypothetical protein AA11237_1669 [Acidocella aminolytica 101 = DSM 11237]SHF55224.1 hypothetical protein SAMN02746095_03678 [Acidocella aminolytica 101 = DSM 11237]